MTTTHTQFTEAKKAAEEMMRCLEMYVSYGAIPIMPAATLQQRSLAALKDYYETRARVTL